MTGTRQKTTHILLAWTTAAALFAASSNVATAPEAPHANAAKSKPRHKSQQRHNIKDENDQVVVHVIKRKLTPEEQEWQSELTKLASEYFYKIQKLHPELKPEWSEPPQVVLLPTDKPYLDALYVKNENKIYMTRPVGAEKGAWPAATAHDAAHPFDATEKGADRLAAEVVGPQKYIDALHRFFHLPSEVEKIYMKTDKGKEHGTVEQREEAIQDAFPDQNLVVQHRRRKFTFMIAKK